MVDQIGRLDVCICTDISDMLPSDVYHIVHTLRVCISSYTSYGHVADTLPRLHLTCTRILGNAETFTILYTL